MELGLTWPLQRLLRTAVPYGEERKKLFCWDAHCIQLHGRSSLLLVHCVSRYTCVRFDLLPLDWKRLPELAEEEIRLSLFEAGIPETVVRKYLTEAGHMAMTRTHGRREVAYLNLAWEDVLASDLLVDRETCRQPLLGHGVNRLARRCAGYEDKGSPEAFLRRCLEQEYAP